MVARLNLFLTYPNIVGDVQLSDLQELILTKLKLWGVKYLIACRELHADGRPHFHAFFICHRGIKEGIR